MVRRFGRPVRVVPRYHMESLTDPFQASNTDEPMRLHRVESMNDKFVVLLSRPSSDSPSYLMESLKDVFWTGTPTEESTVKLHQESEEWSDFFVKLYQLSEEESTDSYQVSIELSQHDPRREWRPTDDSDLPKYIEVVPYREIVKERLDAIEAGFASLLRPLPLQDDPPHRPGYTQLSDESDSMSDTSHLSAMSTVNSNNLKSVSMRTIKEGNLKSV